VTSSNPPLFSILPVQFKPREDSRRPGNPVRVSHLDSRTFTFTELTPKSCEILTPVILNLFVFDVKLKRRVTETWSYLPSIKQSGPEVPDLDLTSATSPTITIPLSPPAGQTENLKDDLFLVLVLDRPFMKDPESVDSYYHSPKSGLKKATEAISKMRTDGWWATFAYSAFKISDVPSSGILNFDQIFLDPTADCEYLARKLTKHRKNPKQASFEVTFSVSPPSPEIPELRPYYKCSPHFSLLYRHELLVKIKSVTQKSGGRSLGGVLKLKQNEAVLRSMRLRSAFKHVFSDEVIFALPWPLSAEHSLELDLFDLFPKGRDPPELCGRARLKLFDDSGNLRRGEHSIGSITNFQTNLIDQSAQILFELSPASSLRSSNPIAEELLLRGDFGRARDIPFQTLVHRLPPILDVVFLEISGGSADAFRGMLLLIDKFPCDNGDSRWDDGLRAACGDSGVLPIDHLDFYARHCALRSCQQSEGESPTSKYLDIDSFFEHFVDIWLAITLEDVRPNRADLRSAPFLLEILFKCLALDERRLYSELMGNLIESLQRAVALLGVAGEEAFAVGRRLNLHLSFFYKDLADFDDKLVFLTVANAHIACLDVRQEYGRTLLLDFLSCCLTKQTLTIFCAPHSKTQKTVSAFGQVLLPKLEVGFTNWSFTESVISLFVSVLRSFDPAEFALLAPGLMGFLGAYGRIAAEIRRQRQLTPFIFPFTLALALFAQSDLSRMEPNAARLLTAIIETAGEAMRKPQGTVNYSHSVPVDGHRRNFLSSNELGGRDFSLQADKAWSKIAFFAQLIAVRVIENGSGVAILNNCIVPCFGQSVAAGLFETLKKFTLNFLNAHTNLVFSNPEACAYKLIANIVGNLSAANVAVLDHLWQMENTLFQSNARVSAFFMRALHKYHLRDRKDPKAQLDEKKLKLLEGSPFHPLASAFEKLWSEYRAFDGDNPLAHDFLAEAIVKLADFFRPSPDCRVRVLLKLGQLHSTHGYKTECAITQLRAAALVAEVMAYRHKIPSGVFSDLKHPANCLVAACPSAACEVFEDVILGETPEIRGYCDSNYFCECGLMFLLRTANDTCKAQALFELCIAIDALLRPLAQNRQLWDVLGQRFRNGQQSWNAIHTFGASADRPLGIYYRIQFQDAGTFIYRDAGMANLWQMNERIPKMAEYFCGKREVVCVNDKAELDPATFVPDKYYVHIKSVEQYFRQDELDSRVTIFEQNHNVQRFYFDIPDARGKGPEDLAALWLKRTIFTLPHPVPYILSRLEVPPGNIERLEFSPIEGSCQTLQRQIDKMAEATLRGDFRTLQPLLKGSLIPEVNAGAIRIAEIFLSEGPETQHMRNLRSIFRKFIDVNTAGVIKHMEHAKTVPVYKQLHEALEIGLNQLQSGLSPYLK
jgi:hypothetical protein